MPADVAAEWEVGNFGNGKKSTQALTLEKITQATNGFSVKIGHGGVGDVFYGELEDVQEVAVKF